MTYSGLTLAARRTREQEPGSGLMTLTGAGRIGPRRPELHAQTPPTAFPPVLSLRSRRHQARESPERTNRVTLQRKTMLVNQHQVQSSVAGKRQGVRTLVRYYGRLGFTAPDTQTGLHPVRNGSLQLLTIATCNSNSWSGVGTGTNRIKNNNKTKRKLACNNKNVTR